MLENHKAFFDYLNFLQEHLDLTLSIKDRRGWSAYLDREFSMSVIPYLLHSSSYCNLIKTNKSLLRKCSHMGCFIENKCRKTRSAFYGQCHAGVEEFVMPIFAGNNDFIGFITAGSFQSISPKALGRVSKAVQCGGFDEGDALQCYGKLRTNDPLPVNVLEKALGIAAKYLADLYDRNIPKQLTQSPGAYLIEDCILGKVLEIITCRFDQPLTVPEIALQCNCSESYLNHRFKRSTGTNIRAYINWLRTEKARELLKNKEFSISQVSSLVGFNDPDYFSKVFAGFTGQSPRVYRKSMFSYSMNP